MHPACTTVDGMLSPFATSFAAGAVARSMTRYTSAFAQHADANDMRRPAYSVRLDLAGSAPVTHGTQTGMRGLLGVVR